MKRLLALILIAIALFSLFACGSTDTETPDPLGPSDGVKPNDQQNSETPSVDDDTPSGDVADQPNTEDPGNSQESEKPEEPQPDASLVQNGSFRGEGDIALYLYVEWSDRKSVV